MKLWIDDYRPKPIDYDVHVRNAVDAITAIKTGVFTDVSFDFDLGSQLREHTGHGVACWVAREARAGNIPRFTWRVHSDNVQGAAKIRWALEQADKFWTENEMAGTP